MSLPRHALFLLVAVGVALAIVAAAWFHSWGLLALLLVGSAGLVWYRIQVARSAAVEKFFGDMGEETRMTGLQGSPSEMPTDRAPTPGQDQH